MKKILSTALVLVITLSIFSVNTLAVSNSYSSDYRYWSQGASGYPRVKKYGCYIVALSRMIVEAGVDTSSSFNPDVFAEWEEANSYITDLDTSIGQNSMYAPEKYAEKKNKELKYICTKSYSDSTLWEYIKSGYYCIVHIKYDGGSHHYVFVSNQDSIDNETLMFYESWSSATSVGVKKKSTVLATYSGSYISEIYVYKGANSTSAPPTPEPPSNVKSTKTIYKPGEEITFSWGESEYATDYKIEIWNGNTVLYSKNIGNATSFTTSLADIGNCALCVSAGNSVGYSEFTTYSFVVTNSIPNKPNSIVSSKTVCNTGEKVTFSWDTVVLATDYWVSIYNGNTKVYNSSVGNVTSFTSPFAYEGTYAFCVNSGNSNGYSESIVYSFVVTNEPPAQPKQIYSDKTVLKPSEKIIFTWDPLNSATDYWVSIYNGSEKIYNASVGDVTSFEVSFSDCGTYAFCVSSGNKNGYSLSTSYRFYVTDKIPVSPSKIISSKSVYRPNEEVVFSWEPIDLATDYWVSIYNGSEKIYNANVGNITSFKTSFNNCGNYAFCVSSGNSNGYSASTRVNYVVTDSIVVDSKVTKSNNSYKIRTILYNIEESCEVIVAAYKEGKFVALTSSPYNLEDVNTTLSGDIDEIKVMVWDSLSGLHPLCEAEVIPSSEWE